METPTLPRTAQDECGEEAPCEKTPLEMKVSFTEPPRLSLQVQLPELAQIPEGQEEPLHCKQLHNGKIPIFSPFEPTLHIPPNRGCVPDPESIPHAHCVTRCANTHPQTLLAAGEEQRHSGEQFPSPSSSAASPKVGAVYWHFLIMLMTHKPWWQ